MTPQLKTLLCRYPWPGNVRELRNEIERMRLMNSDKLLYDVDDLDIRFKTFSEKDIQKTSALQNNEIPGSTRFNDNAPSLQKVISSPSDISNHVNDILKQSTSPIQRLQRLRSLFQEHPTLTRADIIKILRVSPGTATSALKALCREGFIKKVKPYPAPRTHYFVLDQNARLRAF